MSDPIYLKFFEHGESYHYEPIEVHDGEKWCGRVEQKVDEPVEFQIEIPLDQFPATATHLRLTAQFCMEAIPPNGHHCEDGGWQFVLCVPAGTRLEQQSDKPA